jgi:hypothetical protein
MQEAVAIPASISKKSVLGARTPRNVWKIRLRNHLNPRGKPIKMIVSEERLAANRRNALRSTGPKSAEGKEKSRANALKHGLCSSKLVSEDLALVEQRSYEFFVALCPQTSYQRWVADEMAIISLRVDHVERMERRARDFRALKAELCWDDDRRLHAIRLGSMIQSNPQEIVEELRRTPQGCEWLMTRWAMLAHVADVKKAWTADQTRLAFDLLGTPEEFREGQTPGTALDFNGHRLDPDEDLASFARREIASLKTRRDEVDPIDEVAHALAKAALNIQEEHDPDMKKLRRYEGTLHSRFRWFTNQFHAKIPNGRPLTSLRNNWKGQADEDVAAPEPEEKSIVVAETPAQPEVAIETEIEVVPESAVEPETSAEPETATEPETDSVSEPETETLAAVDTRADKKIRKAETRRQSRKRKSERLRA